jgi:hypothetical protein
MKKMARLTLPPLRGRKVADVDAPGLDTDILTAVNEVLAALFAKAQRRRTMLKAQLDGHSRRRQTR